MHGDIKNKFIVVENEKTQSQFIFISKCVFHKDLLKLVNDRVNDGFKFKCIGGGDFYVDLIDVNNKILNLNGTSHQFGDYPFELCIKLIKNKQIFDNPFLTRSVFERNFKTINIAKINIYNQIEYCETIKF